MTTLDASKVPPSQFQRRKGSIYSTPQSRDGHIAGKDRDKAYHDKVKEKVGFRSQDFVACTAKMLKCSLLSHRALAAAFLVGSRASRETSLLGGGEGDFTGLKDSSE